MDWYQVKFLESPENLKGLLKESIGREPSSKIATDISAHIQQGRLFLEAAENSPPEIKPLQVFYGIVGLSKALAASRILVSPEALVRAHGLKDQSENNSKIEDLKVLIEARGTFQHLNDVICGLESINYFGTDSEPCKIYKGTDRSDLLNGKCLSLKDILSRMPSLAPLYQQTFNEKANCLTFSFYNDDHGLAHLRIDVPSQFRDRTTLESMITQLRTEYPFLNNWLLSEAQRAWGYSVLTFTNSKNDGVSEFSDIYLKEYEGKFSGNNAGLEVLDFGSLFPPLAGGIINTQPTYIKPIAGINISEYSLVYLGAFLLSSLVRYRPQIWVHSIRGRVTQQRSFDDRCMALIEHFLDDILSYYPAFVINCMKTKR